MFKVSFLTFGGYFSYVWVLVILSFGGYSLTLWGSGFLRFGVSCLSLRVKNSYVRVFKFLTFGG